jgi:antirestriction protein ArdC
MSGQAKIYEMITDRIVKMLESGVAPWRKPWSGGRGRGAMPANLHSKKEYRGINIFLLSSLGFSSRFFLSFKQVEAAGGRVRKGEKGCPVIFWKRLESVDKETGEKKEIPMLRYYTVFNLTQCEGIDPKKVPQEERPEEFDFSPIEQAEAIVAGMPKRPEITHLEQRAYYRPLTDSVNMPHRETFPITDHYYSTLFHELAHSTGAEHRLNRRQGSEARHMNGAYGREELVAEMTASFLCAVSGIIDNTVENSAAYLKGWIEILKGEPKMAVQAAAQAQKAADYILDVRYAPATEA